ncbi:MAG: prepilin-type N-terminal cleavage/methylation domain-containing protein [Patescibacteria group bacterium]
MRPDHHQGLTLIEIMVVIAILTILFAVGLLMSMDAFRGYSRRSERDTLVSVFQRARSSAIANVNQHQWGACLDTSVPTSPDYVIFSGPSYGSAITKLAIPANSGVTITDTSSTKRFNCSLGGIVFNQLTGDTSDNTITVNQGAITSTISTNVEGRIDW